VYRITCGPTGRVYVGQTTDVRRRFAQHAARPPRRMADDARAHQPFNQHFNLDVLATCATQAQADSLEAHFILLLKATGPMGYNDLPGAPRASAKVHAMARARAAKGPPPTGPT
jgi:predicted GIY-YIG superfamily endonuclease